MSARRAAPAATKPTRPIPTAVEVGLREIARERGARVAGLSLQAINLLARMVGRTSSGEAVDTDLLHEARLLVRKFDALSKLGRQR